MLRASSPIHVELFLTKLSADAEIGFTRSGLHADYARWRTNNPRGRLVGSSLVNKTFMIMSASCGACGKFSNSREENSLHVFLFPLALLLLLKFLFPKILSLSFVSIAFASFHRPPPVRSRFLRRRNRKWGLFRSNLRELHSTTSGWNSLSSRSPNVDLRLSFRTYALSIQSRRYWIVEHVYFCES